VWSGNLEVTKSEKWPAGQIVAIPHTFAVAWQVENPAIGFDAIVEEKIRPLISVQEAWGQLRHEHPRLFTNASINCRGKHNPNWNQTRNSWSCSQV
jgi:hypothetical protein